MTAQKLEWEANTHYIHVIQVNRVCHAGSLFSLTSTTPFTSIQPQYGRGVPRPGGTVQVAAMQSDLFLSPVLHCSFIGLIDLPWERAWLSQSGRLVSLPVLKFSDSGDENRSERCTLDFSFNLWIRGILHWSRVEGRSAAQSHKTWLLTQLLRANKECKTLHLCHLQCFKYLI